MSNDVVRRPGRTTDTGVALTRGVQKQLSIVLEVLAAGGLCAVEAVSAPAAHQQGQRFLLAGLANSR